MADETTETEQTTLPRARDFSKLVKALCLIGLIASGVLKWLGIFHIDGIGEICTLWAVAYGIGAGTIDLNLFVANLKGKED